MNRIDEKFAELKKKGEIALIAYFTAGFPSAVKTVEIVKKAEKSDCLVLRLVETDGCVSTASLSFTKEMELQEIDLLEWNALGEKRFGTAFELCFKPFEIKTFKVKAR